jgi:hypothetical protein
MSLSVTPTQKTSILDPIDTELQQAFADGVDAGSGVFLAAIQHFLDLTPEQQALTRDTFRLVVAAMLKAMNVKAPLPDPVTDGSGYSGLISYLDGSTFSNMNMIVQNGIIVGVTG